MSSQKALILRSKDAGKFELSTQLLVKVYAAALNPVDIWIQKRGFVVDRYGFPAVPGSDGAGVVEAVGEGVTDFEKGVRV